jgi:hypothetical protein
MVVRRFSVILLAVLMMVMVAIGSAIADVPLGPARPVPCPGGTGGGPTYQGLNEPYRCHSAVVDPLGNTVILRQGRSDGSGAHPDSGGCMLSMITT